MIRKMNFKKNVVFSLIVILAAFLFFSPFSSRAAEKTLLMLPLKIFGDPSKAYLSEGVRAMFASRLSGRDIRVISRERLEAVLSEEEKAGVTSKTRAKDLAKAFKAEYVILGSITTLGESYSLDLYVLDLSKDEPVERRVSETLTEAQFIARMSDMAYRVRDVMAGKEVPIDRPIEKPAPPPEKEVAGGLFTETDDKPPEPVSEEAGLTFGRVQDSYSFSPKGRIRIGQAVMAFDVGDADGDGQAELLVLSRTKLLLYQRKEDYYVLVDSFEPSMGEEFLKVSIGDADRDGKTEIFVVSLYGERARTTVVRWQGKFTRLHHHFGHIRTVRQGSSGRPILLFQDSRIEQFFKGSVYMMEQRGDDRFEKGDALPKLDEAQFYTLAPYDMDGDGTDEWMGLDDEDRLSVWNHAGKRLWTGNNQIAGTNNAIRVGRKRGFADIPWETVFNGRIVVSDLNGDGKPEVLAVDNRAFLTDKLDVKWYTKGKLKAYRIDGNTLTQAWATGEIGYCVMEIQTQGRAIFIAAQKGKYENISKGYGYVFWFD